MFLKDLKDTLEHTLKLDVPESFYDFPHPNKRNTTMFHGFSVTKDRKVIRFGVSPDGQRVSCFYGNNQGIKVFVFEKLNSTDMSEVLQSVVNYFKL